MTGRHRIVVAALVLLATLVGMLLTVYAANACPTPTTSDPCPDVGLHRAVVVALAACALALLVTPFAFLGEFVTRRRIVYRGAWERAARRGILLGALLAALAGLRLGGALSVPVALFGLIVAAVVEWFAVRRFDSP